MKFGTASINSVVYGNGRFVAVGINGKGAYSTDGFTWTEVSDMQVGTSMQSSLFSVAYVNLLPLEVTEKVLILLMV